MKIILKTTIDNMPEAGGVAGGAAKGVLDADVGGGSEEGCLWWLWGSILCRTDSLALKVQ